MSEGKKEILLGDCLELMKDIPNGSIDMILCDLPYGTTQCKWDTIIPFDKLWEQYERIIKPNGAIILFGSEPFSSYLRMSNIKLYRYDIVWNKIRCSNFALANKQPLKAHENISVFYKKLPKYNPQMGIGKPYDKTKYDGAIDNSNITGHTIKRTRKINNGERFPVSIIQFSMDWRRQDQMHPTQKPVSLFEYLIKTYTNDNDLVLDNTAGSGTTAIACLNTNRQFIVMEKEQKYYDIILKRVGDFNKKFETQTLFGNEM
jgi:DNA modification methylase